MVGYDAVFEVGGYNLHCSFTWNFS